MLLKSTNLRLVERYFCLVMQTTFRTKNLFHHSTVIVQKIHISAINGTMFLIRKTLIQLTAKPNFELKLRQTFVALSEVRVSVEWLFGDIINFFRFLDYKKNLKIGLSCEGKMYLVCALLRNAITSNLFICCYMVIRRLSFSTWRRQL